MAGVWSGDEPLVVRLVNVLVDSRVVLEPVNPVDEEVGEDEEKWNRENGVGPTKVRDVVVKLAVTTNLENKPWDCEEVEGEESTH